MAVRIPELNPVPLTPVSATMHTQKLCVPNTMTGRGLSQGSLDIPSVGPSRSYHIESNLLVSILDPIVKDRELSPAQPPRDLFVISRRYAPGWRCLGPTHHPLRYLGHASLSGGFCLSAGFLLVLEGMVQARLVHFLSLA